MAYQLLVIFHLLGASVWIGGHVVVVSVVIPAALRERAVARIVEFEHAFGKLGLGTLVIQTVTGLWLATYRIGHLNQLFSAPNPASFLVLAKIGLLLTNLGLAAHASRRILPRLSPETLKTFAIHAWIVTVISVLMLIIGVAIRTGGLM